MARGLTFKISIILLPLIISGFLSFLNPHQGILSELVKNVFMLQIFAVLLSVSLFFYFLFWNDFKIVEKFISRNQKKIVFFAVLLITVFYAGITFNQHRNFETHAFDFAIYDRTAWHYGRLQFNYYENLIFKNKMADHFEPILILPGIIYLIYESPYVLLGLEALIIALGFVPIYLIAKKKLKSGVAGILLGFSFVFFLGVLSAVNFPIHPGSWLATFYGFMLYFALERKFKWYYLFLCLALLSKESAFLHLLYIGIFLAIFLKERKHGLITISTGIIYCFFIIYLLMPGLNNGSPYVHGIYNYILDNPLNFLGDSIKTPILSLKYLFEQGKLQTLIASLASTGFLAVLSPVFLVLVLPMFLERFLAHHSSMYTLNFHYSIPVAIMLYFSTIYSICWITKKISIKNLAVYLSAFVLLCSITVTCVSPNNLINYKSWKNFKLNDKHILVKEAIKQIPGGSSVLTQDTIVPHLDYSHVAGLFPDNFYKYDYILLSKEKSYSSWPVDKETVSAEINNLISNENFTIFYQNEISVIFKNNGSY